MGTKASFVANNGAIQLRKTLNSVACLLDYSPSTQSRGPATIDGADFGMVNILRCKNVDWNWGRRSIQHIRADRIDNFLISMPQHYVFEARQEGAVSLIEPGYFTILSTSKPFVSWCDLKDSHEDNVIAVSGTMLRQRVPHIDKCCGQALKIRSGGGQIMRSLYDLSLTDGDGLTSGFSRQFGTTIVDAIAEATLTAPELASLKMTSNQTAYKRLYESAVEYIEENLSNAELDIAKIAEHCRMSQSSIYAAFAAMESSVSAYIREARLQRCQAMLRNRMMNDKLIIEIALMWGFNNAAHFSNLYKIRFGHTPREERMFASQ